MWTAVEIEPDSCTPLDNTTFLFAYSNDFDPLLVDNWLRYLQPSNDVLPHYSKFASIRFDIKNEEEFEYQNTFGEIVSYVQNHLPDPSLGFDSQDTGSNVLRMIDRFLDNAVVPVCGSKMTIYVKRYPNETDYSRIVAKMRQHHSYLTIFASTNPSGGYHPETLYDLDSKTNGLCAFDDDDNILWAEERVQTVYCVLASVRSESKANGQYWFTVMMQDNGPMTVVQTVMLSWINDNDNGHLGKNGTIFEGSGNHIRSWEDLNNAPYNVQLDFNYTDSKARRVQIRVHNLYIPINYWVSYDN
ncbi:unnamed protein product [Caenorhabditis brenneri]